MSRKQRLETPDGRYFVSRGRLWRKSDPNLPDQERRAAIKSLMQARHSSKTVSTAQAAAAAKSAVEEAKRRLGEIGQVWWSDGAPDETGRHPANSSYADWWMQLPDAVRAAAEGVK